MVHQFGHMLGLAHTNRITSAMVPFYTDWVNTGSFSDPVKL